MKRRIFALLFVSLTLVTMGVGVFAQQPNIKSPATDYLGYWQNTPQNEGYLTGWFLDICPTCGANGYGITLDGIGNRPLNDGDIFSIVDYHESVRNDSMYDIGKCYNIETPHPPDEHNNGRLFYRNNGGTRSFVFTITPKPTDTSTRFVWLVCPYNCPTYTNAEQFWSDYIDGATNNTIRSYASSSIVQAYYTETLIDTVYQDAYQNGESGAYQTGYDEGYDTGKTDGYRNGYNDGTINGTQNMTAISYISEALNGVTSAVANILNFEVMGVSVTFLFSLVVAVAVISLIIKIIRG